jgi:hypothetical protein
MPYALASPEQGHLAVWTAWPFAFLSLGPLISFPLSGTFLNEMGFQLADQFAGPLFYLQKRRFGMGCVPRIHFSDDFLTELFEVVLVWHNFSAFSFLLSFPSRKMRPSPIFAVFAHVWCFLATNA